MHKSTTFLILFGTLLVAGGFVLYEREEMREWQVRQQFIDQQHILPTDNTPSVPEINPATGWKIFRDKEGAIIFEYPKSFELVSKLTEQGRYFSVRLKNDSYYFRISIPPPEKGFEGAEKVTDVNMNLGGASFKIDILDLASSKEKPYVIAFSRYEEEDALLKLLGYPTPNVGGIHADMQCVSEACSSEEALVIFKQIVSSIRLASDPR